LITEKDKTTMIIKLVKSIGEVAPQAIPIMSEPRFGRRNSALEITASNFIVSNIIKSKTHILEPLKR